MNTIYYVLSRHVDESDKRGKEKVFVVFVAAITFIVIRDGVEMRFLRLQTRLKNNNASVRSSYFRNAVIYRAQDVDRANSDTSKHENRLRITWPRALGCSSRISSSDWTQSLRVVWRSGGDTFRTGFNGQA